MVKAVEIPGTSPAGPVYKYPRLGQKLDMIKLASGRLTRYAWSKEYVARAKPGGGELPGRTHRLDWHTAWENSARSRNWVGPGQARFGNLSQWTRT